MSRFKKYSLKDLEQELSDLNDDEQLIGENKIEVLEEIERRKK